MTRRTVRSRDRDLVRRNGGRDSARRGTCSASEVASQIAIHAERPAASCPKSPRAIICARCKPWSAHALADRPGFEHRATSTPSPRRADRGWRRSLMIGTSAAKGLAVARRKPYLAINHLEGHLLSPFFGAPVGCARRSRSSSAAVTPCSWRSQSFGKYRLLGQTQDDAAGEAFDKVGKLLGLPYPGGPNVNRLANEGNPARIDFPRSMLDSGDFDFSFSGLKTAVRYLLPKLGEYQPSRRVRIVSGSRRRCARRENDARRERRPGTGLSRSAAV